MSAKYRGNAVGGQGKAVKGQGKAVSHSSWTTFARARWSSRSRSDAARATCSAASSSAGGLAKTAMVCRRSIAWKSPGNGAVLDTSAAGTQVKGAVLLSMDRQPGSSGDS